MGDTSSQSDGFVELKAWWWRRFGLAQYASAADVPWWRQQFSWHAGRYYRLGPFSVSYVDGWPNGTDQPLMRHWFFHVVLTPTRWEPYRPRRVKVINFRWRPLPAHSDRPS